MNGSGDFSIGSAVWPGLSKLNEECGETIQVIGKLMGTGGERMHWDGTDLKVRLEEELGDILGAVDFVLKHCDLDGHAVAERSVAKLNLFNKWHAEQDRARRDFPDARPAEPR